MSGLLGFHRLFGKLEIAVSVENNLLTLVVGMFFFLLFD